MNKIESIEQYKEITGRAKKNGYTLSNCFFLPAAIRSMTESGTLLYREIKDGLLLLDDRGEFYRCYYFFAADSEPDSVELDKNAVIEFPFNGEMNEKQLLQVSKIEKMGFCLGRKSGMMNAAPDMIVSKSDVTPDLCRVADEQDSNGVLDLLRRHFNPLYSFIPTREEMSLAIQNGSVLVIRDGEHVAAALVSGFEKKAASVNQIAVDDDYRRKGYARSLMQTYHQMYSDRVDTFHHWVDLDNSSAIAMYTGFGYSFGLRKANEYILMTKGEN